MKWGLKMCFNLASFHSYESYGRGVWTQMFVGRLKYSKFVCVIVRSFVRLQQQFSRMNEPTNEQTSVYIYVLGIHATIPLNQRYIAIPIRPLGNISQWIGLILLSNGIELLCKQNARKQKSLFQTNCIPLFELRNRINLHRSVTKCQRCESLFHRITY